MKLNHLISSSRPSACQPAGRSVAAFTMIEIALCLAIIGFALVAIIGVLPTGLNVQKDNREETIINQDAAVWMDAIRNGAQGHNDLTNYVLAITNVTTRYVINSGVAQQAPDASYLGPPGLNPEINVFTLTNDLRNGSPAPSPWFQLTNGWHIIGALSRPRFEWDPSGRGFYSNYIIANVRAMSGVAMEKYPQTNVDVLDSGFAYRLIVQNDAYVPFDTNNIQSAFPQDPSALDPSLPDIGSNTNTIPSSMTAAQRQAYWDQIRANRRVLGVAYTSAQDVRLTFRWPLLPNGDAGNGRQTFRFMLGGQSFRTNDLSTPPVLGLNLHFFRPGTYVKAQ